MSAKDYLTARFRVDESGCWLWVGSTNPVTGYAVAGRRGYAHRLSYETFTGPIPDGLTIDHLCRVRNCVNPEHLEAVTLRENILRSDNPAARNARKTHCHRGHLLVSRWSTGGRRCDPCTKAFYRREADKRRKGEVRGPLEWYLENPARVYVRKEVAS